jgi:hypothetical protein
MDHITELFCILDDFCKKFNESLEKALISDQKIRIKKSALSLSEAMTIVILFHQSGFRFFKYFYCQMILHQANATIQGDTLYTFLKLDRGSDFRNE